MVIKEIFPNPTVKQVVFEIRFPNLFYMENKIGDLQLRIMKEFPQSSLLFQKAFMLVDIGPKTKPEEIVARASAEERGKKIWNFKSKKNYELNVQTNRLNIISQYHKTYNLGNTDKFRDVIRFVLDHFLAVTAIPIFNRIGLRYIDECPLPAKENDTFKSWYNSVFPIDRFSIADADEMFFRTVAKKGDFYLIYMETLQKRGDEYKLILDFDGFAKDVSSEDCLNVTDELHRVISEEYVRTIKEPVYKYMRQEKKMEGE